MATNEAPGRAFQTRKNAQPFIQSALRQASVGQQLSASIGDYTLHRYNMAEQIKLDEATIEGQNALRQLAYDYTQDGNPESVLDGSNPRWFTDVERIKKGLLKKLGKNRNAAQKFSASFNIAESNQRFSLRNKVSENSKTKMNKQMADLFKYYEMVLSEEDVNTKVYDMTVNKFRTELKGNKVGLDERLIELGFYNMNKNIATKVINAWGNNDPLKINALEAYYNDDLDIKDLPEGAKYLDHVLRGLSDSDSKDIIETAFEAANKSISNDKELDDTVTEVRENLKNDWIQNYFAIDATDANGDEIQYGIMDVKNLIFGYEDFDPTYGKLVTDAFAKAQGDGRDYFTGAEVQSLIRQMVDNPIRGTTIADDVRNAMEVGFLGNADRIFVTANDPQEVRIQASNNFVKAEGLISDGTIGLQELHEMLDSSEFPGGFTEANYQSLKASVNAMRDQNFASLTQALKADYQILGETAMNKEFGDKLTVAYFEVTGRLKTWYAENRKIADRETIASEIINIKKELGEKQSADFVAMMKRQMGEYNRLYSQMENKFNINDPIEKIEEVMAARIDEMGTDLNKGGEIANQNANLRSLIQVIEMLRGL